MIDKKVLKERCLGCEACCNACPKNAINMVQDSFGFLVPKVDYSKCIKCKRCINVCPFLNKYNGVPVIPNIYSARIKNNESLFESTSGGVFTAISDYFLHNNGHVCGAIYGDGFVVQHTITNSSEIRNKMRGAKYIQSSVGFCYRKIKKMLENNENVLFVGTPCQVHALKLFLGKEYTTLLTIDIICHGVSSPLFFFNYLLFFEKKYGKINSIRFRSKKYGWRGNNLEISLSDGNSLCNVKDTKKYTNLYGSGHSMRNSCFSCNYATIFRVGDFSIGDYWGIEKVNSILDDNKGCSIVFINNSKAKKYFDKIKCDLIFESRDIPDILQPNLLRPTKKPKDYCTIQKLLTKEGYWKKY